MAAPVQGIGSLLPPALTTPAAAPDTGAASGQDFGDLLGTALTEAGKAEKSADEMATKFAAGDPEIGLHEVMIAAEKANVTVRYAVTLKNKLLEAYRELMNTPL